ncbi:PREDICTED: rab3 GTPase-activating protein catalytic subunit [Fragaria vesca subsp. vesca]|uniref:rab3 GTPase-activating protein catalytic subunit n=1 Tax=Fragaria vesca subsp. vesca TaxID=101020 RepID=UPI0002C35935|nr:PREDICTED: rab3 GTPase-activating protein catalytic subunit [Fragaria vesca subsp. vesca]
MASSSKMETDETQEEEEEEEVEHFDDFTLASPWEKFISDIEAVCRQWIANGPKNLLKKDAREVSEEFYKVKYELKFALKSYCMEYYFGSKNDGNDMVWDSRLHDLQLCFGVKDFLVIAPQSASGVVLDAPEASKLLSAVAIALSNCSSLWPAFVPVHVPVRRAYIGIQNMGTVFTRRFEADLIGSQVPVKLMHLEGLYELFVSKFAYSTLDFAMHLFKVHFTMKLTYRSLPHEDDDVQGADADVIESGDDLGGDMHNRTQWDDDCPWSEWYTAEDPVKGFELVALWSEKVVESSMEMAELENSSPHEAEKWILSPNMSSTLTDSSEGNRVGFASQLCLLVDALNMSFEAQFMEDFVSVENPGSDHLKSSMVIPPPTVIDRVLKELFHDGARFRSFASGERKTSRIKAAPLESLFAQFCLHSLWLGNCNIRAISVIWIEFVREVRWCWEQSQTLPLTPAFGSIDLSTCVIYQKLHMLAICIERKRQLNEEFQDCVGSMDHSSPRTEEDGLDEGSEDSCIMQTPAENLDGKRDSPAIPDDLQDSEQSVSRLGARPEHATVSADLKPLDCIRRGSAGVTGMMLLNSYQSMHAPFTQEPPLMTEDMHEERLQAVEAFGDSLNFSALLEREILTSDMSAFKAANPDAVFEDFIRWHSPGDWESDITNESGSPNNPTTEGPKDDWPPRGRLSKRMSESGNLWRKIWNDAPALPASEQKPLMDPIREGEKILHYLETLRPHQLLEQMICTAFSAAADTLAQTNYGGLKQMTTKLDQLYLTMTSALRPLQANRLSAHTDTIEDIRRLSGVFEHVEKLLTIAASLHRKFLQAPRLSEAIFRDCCNFYFPRMGTSSSGDNAPKEFEKQQVVTMNERPVVSNMFTPPTANQSWRKVLSLGNLLNGHEPVLREIIFSKRDKVSGNHYAARTPSAYQDELETYRMYICGTSNDLRVALSVVSCD